MNLSSINLQTTNPPILHDPTQSDSDPGRIPYPPTTDTLYVENKKEEDRFRLIVIVSIVCILLIVGRSFIGYMFQQSQSKNLCQQSKDLFLLENFFDRCDITYLNAINGLSVDVNFKLSERQVVIQRVGRHDEFDNKMTKNFFDKVFDWIQQHIGRDKQLQLVINYTKPQSGSQQLQKKKKQRQKKTTDLHLLAIGFLFLDKNNININTKSNKCHLSFSANSLLMMLANDDHEDIFSSLLGLRSVVQFNIFDKTSHVKKK